MQDDPIADFFSWYSTRPPYTKTFITISFFMGVGLSMNWLNIAQLYYNYEVGIGEMEIWRMITSLLWMDDIGFFYIFQAYMTYTVLYYV